MQKLPVSDRGRQSFGVQERSKVNFQGLWALGESAYHKEQPGIIDELMTDPTLRRTLDLTCPSCGHTEWVPFLRRINDQSRHVPGPKQADIQQCVSPKSVIIDVSEMIFFYVCCYCNHLFRDEPLAKPDDDNE